MFDPFGNRKIKLQKNNSTKDNLNLKDNSTNISNIHNYSINNSNNSCHNIIHNNYIYN